MQLPESRMEFVKDRPGHDLRYALSPKKVHQTLGFVPKISIDQGINDLITWYKDNKSWWSGKLANDR
jgi:dTDP-glucose 4,6-dehydratase